MYTTTTRNKLKYNNECNAIDLCIRERNIIDEEFAKSFSNKIAKVNVSSLTKNNQLLHKINKLDITDHVNLNNKCSPKISIKNENLIYMKKITHKYQIIYFQVNRLKSQLIKNVTFFMN